MQNVKLKKGSILYSFQKNSIIFKKKKNILNIL